MTKLFNIKFDIGQIVTVIERDFNGKVYRISIKRGRQIKYTLEYLTNEGQICHADYYESELIQYKENEK